MLWLCEFQRGREADAYLEILNGTDQRWFELDGTEFQLPFNNGDGVSWSIKDENPAIPEWYVEPN